MRPGSMPGCFPLSSGRERLRPVIVPGSRSGCSGLDSGRGTGGRSGLSVAGSSRGQMRPGTAEATTVTGIPEADAAPESDRP